MTEPGSSLLRPWLAGLLVLVLLLAGVERGRALAGADRPDAPLRIAGLVVPICHAHEDTGTGTGGGHDCCDACAIAAPLALPDAPDWTVPPAVATMARHDIVLAWAPTLARVRTPRLAQGPPRLT